MIQSQPMNDEKCLQSPKLYANKFSNEFKQRKVNSEDYWENVIYTCMQTEHQPQQNIQKI